MLFYLFELCTVFFLELHVAMDICARGINLVSFYLGYWNCSDIGIYFGVVVFPLILSLVLSPYCVLVIERVAGDILFSPDYVMFHEYY